MIEIAYLTSRADVRLTLSLVPLLAVAVPLTVENTRIRFVLLLGVNLVLTCCIAWLRSSISLMVAFIELSDAAHVATKAFALAL